MGPEHGGCQEARVSELADQQLELWPVSERGNPQLTAILTAAGWRCGLTNWVLGSDGARALPAERRELGLHGNQVIQPSPYPGCSRSSNW